MDKNEYANLVKRRTKNSPIKKNVFFSFLIGGAICSIGEGLFLMYSVVIGLEEIVSRTLVSVSLIVISALLTSVGVYDKLAKIGGAGTLVPITGFANAVISSGIEYKSEGYILGVGVKLFTVAGPVIAYGTAASVVYGIVYYLSKVIA